jgi:hypothetical protein
VSDVRDGAFPSDAESFFLEKKAPRPAASVASLAAYVGGCAPESMMEEPPPAKPGPEDATPYGSPKKS